MDKEEFITIDGEKYRKCKSLWNGNLITYEEKVDEETGIMTRIPIIPEFRVCNFEDWIMVNGIEYEKVHIK